MKRLILSMLALFIGVGSPRTHAEGSYAKLIEADDIPKAHRHCLKKKKAYEELLREVTKIKKSETFQELSNSDMNEADLKSIIQMLNEKIKFWDTRMSDKSKFIYYPFQKRVKEANKEEFNYYMKKYDDASKSYTQLVSLIERMEYKGYQVYNDFLPEDIKGCLNMRALASIDKLEATHTKLSNF